MMQTAAPLAREKLFNMRMSAEEWERLDSLAKHYGLNAAGVIRMLIKERHDTLRSATDMGASKPAPKPRRK